MALSLQTLRPSQKPKTTKRVGRGNASGVGSYSGRGIKGQKARTGGRKGLKRRGLKQFLMQLPKARGFSQPKNIFAVTLERIASAFKEGDHVTPQELIKRGILPKGMRVKVLHSVGFAKKISVSAHAISEKAKAAVESAGGTVKLIGKR
jgi:large subunit ribosomal protein L15